MQSDEHHINTVLRSWNKFPAHDEPDFNCLVNEVWTALNEGLGQSDLYLVIQNEFMNHIGAEGPADDVAQIAAELSGWWNSRKDVQ